MPTVAIWTASPELEFHAFVGGGEAEPLVEAVCVCPPLVRGQLHERATAPAGLADRPLHHRAADPGAPGAVGDPDRLDLSPQRAAPGQARQERQLHGADDRAAGVSDE